jgi:hypothetical protein
VGGIKEILPVAEIMQRLVAETEAALSRAVDFRWDGRAWCALYRDADRSFLRLQIRFDDGFRSRTMPAAREVSTVAD